MPTARRAQLKAPSPPEWWTNGPRSLCPPPLSLGYVLNEITLGSLQETQGLNSLMGPPSSWLLNACVSAAPRVLSQPAVGLQDTPWAEVGGGGHGQQGLQLYLDSRMETDDNTSDARDSDRVHHQAEVDECLMAHHYQLARFIS